MSNKKTVYSNLFAEIFEKDDFQSNLYRFSLSVAINRLKVQEGEITEDKLLGFIQDLFGIDHTNHEKAISEERERDFSQECRLDVLVDRGEDLASKDGTGFSDPFCLLAIVADSRMHNLKKDKYDTKRTKCIKQTLNPVWNETVELSLSRDQVENSFLQIQVWDYDEVNSITKRLNGLKHFHKDDFMGFKSIRLSKIPSKRTEKIVKLKNEHKLQKVSGQLKVGLNLSAVKAIPEMKQKHTDDVIYAGLLHKVVSKSFDEFMNKNRSNSALSWDGKLPVPAEVLLYELERQFCISEFEVALIKWENFNHVLSADYLNVDALYLEKLLADLNQCHRELENQPSQFNTEMMRSSVSLFVQNRWKTIAQHCEKFGLKKNNCCDANLINTRRLVKTLFSMEMYNHIRTSTFEPDIRKLVMEAMDKGVATYYLSVYQKLCDCCENEKEVSNREIIPVGDVTVKGLISLCNELHSDIKLSSSDFHSLFHDILRVDYVQCVCAVIHEKLSRDIDSFMNGIHDELIHEEDRSKLKEQISTLFQLYRSVNDFCHVDDSLQLDYNSNFTNGALSHNQSCDKCSIDEHMLRKWFLPVIYKWIELCKSENTRIINRAVEMDKINRVDDIVKHSSSAVDTVNWLATIMQTWKLWEWPFVGDTYAVGLFLSRDIGDAIRAYIDVVYATVKANGFFDDHGQFDISEELCVALNNLQYVKNFATQVPVLMNFKKLAIDIGAESHGPDSQVALFNLSQAIDESLSEMDRQITEITTEVGKKMMPDICKWIRSFTEFVCDTSASSADVGNESKIKSLDEAALKGSHSLMNYLEENVKMLFEWLDLKNFNIALEVLWKICVFNLRKVVLIEIQNPEASFCYQCSYLLNVLFHFFYEDGNGLSAELLKNHEYQHLHDELKLRSSTTLDLMKNYYSTLHENQVKVSRPSCGVLNVMSSYDVSTGNLTIEVLSASNLIPKDLNGLSDPFVQIRLAPWSLFEEQKVFQTKIKSKTLDPFWEETLSVYVEPQLAETEGAVILFTVLDYDRVGQNELEGEGVLLLKDLIQKKHERGSLFNIPLSNEMEVSTRKPSIFLSDIFSKNQENSKDSDYTCVDGPVNERSNGDVYQMITPLELLQDRSHNDPDAAEFWKRKKMFKKIKN